MTGTVSAMSPAMSSSVHDAKLLQQAPTNKKRHPLALEVHGLTVMIDNYDSFTYNIVQYLQELGAAVHTVRNDEVTLEQLDAMNPKRLVISPGPGTPADAGISKAAVRHFASKIPILGVCLGEQCIIEEFGGKIVQAPCIMHGKVSPMYHDRKGIFEGIPSPINATRYHSLCGEPESLPDCLEVTCTNVEEPCNFRPNWTGSNPKVVQGVRHKHYNIEGVQFHPESITTEYGYNMMANFLKWNNGLREFS